MDWWNDEVGSEHLKGQSFPPLVESHGVAEVARMDAEHDIE